MSDIRIAAAARRWVEARDQERAIVRGLRRCERIPGPPVDAEGCYTYQPEVRNEGDTLCSKTIVDRDFHGDPMFLEQEDWCASCRANLPAVQELRAIRRRMGGLTSALCRAVRSER